MFTLPPVKQVGGGSLNRTVLRWHGPAFGGGLASRSVVQACPAPRAWGYTPDCSHLPCTRTGLGQGEDGRVAKYWVSMNGMREQ